MTRLRRHLLLASTALLAASWPMAGVAAGPPGRVVRVGYLSLGPPVVVGSGRILPALDRLGYVEGKNFELVVRHSGGDPARLPAAAVELVQLQVDVIYAVTSPAALAAQQATRTIPIVAWAMHGAVETGLVSNLRRPGGNLTGTESMAPELDAKRIQLLKQIVPKLTRMGVFYDGGDPGSPQHLRVIGAARQDLGYSTVPIEVRRAEDFDATLAAAPSLDGLLMLTSNLTFRHRQAPLDWALARRLPTLCEFRAMAESGCLLSYGPTFDEITQRCAAQIDKILRGIAPGDLPIEQPTRFELVINLKTARRLGLSVPRELLLRADEVIE